MTQRIVITGSILIFFLACAYAQALEGNIPVTNELNLQTEAPVDDSSANLNEPVSNMQPVDADLESVQGPDTAQSGQEASLPENGDSAIPSDSSSKKVATKPGNVTLDFRDAEIVTVLRILSYKSGVNIVAGPEVTGLVTIQLTDVPWEEALKVILQTYNYGYDRKGNIILVTTIENLKKRREDAQLLADQEPLATKTFILNYAKASEVVASIEKMKTARGSVNFDNRTNAIIVRDTATNLELIGQVIPALDATTPQVLIESKIVETTLSNTENMGIDWVAKVSATGSTRPTIFPFHDRSSDNHFIPDNIPATTTGFTYGTLNFAQFQAVLELLRSRSDTNILSNPRIITLDNQKANITVGTQYPLPTYTYNEEQAKLQVSGWDYKDIGVIFEVTPHVNNAGFVTLDIQPKITAILDYVTVENTQVPRLSTESVVTKVMIEDGNTLIIAGLIKDQKTDVKKKLPILGDIPIAGLIFQKTEKTLSKTDLLIFMTPHIITSGKSS